MYILLHKDPFEPGRNSLLTREQRIYLYRQRKSGTTLKQLSMELNITGERIRQIYLKTNRIINRIKVINKKKYQARDVL